MSNKIAVLVPPFFWSSIPYDGIVLFDYLNKKIDTDLIMFKDDIRLNKVFYGHEKFKFDVDVFKSQNVKTVDDWGSFYRLCKDYKFVLSGVHMMPKPRRNLMNPMPSDVKRKMIITDIGGLDILTHEALNYSETFMVKGDIWKTWMNRMDFNNIYVTGCPQYDYYLHSDLLGIPQAKILSPECFLKKYRINPDKKILMIAPSNPASHMDQFNESLKGLENIGSDAKNNGFQVIIKTYPNDYLFYETEDTYNGVHKRKYSESSPQYEIIHQYVEDSIVVESQDHFSALISSHVLLNMSGSHVAWETYFTKTQSFSMNYKKQIYYGGVKYLPEYVRLPDEIINIEIKKSEDAFSGIVSDKSKMGPYIDRSFSLSNIHNVLIELLGK